MQTPLESFINYKAETGMQCGSYSIDIPKLKPGEQYRFHFDATACVSCRCCEVACNEQNNNPADIKWRRVGEMEGGEFPDTLLLFNSMSCNHCIDPACLKGCPTESYIKFDNGIVFHDDDACIGCQYCTWNCPYGVPTYHEERKIVTKCHMCHERLEEGQSPACVQACPAGAIEIEVFRPDEWLAGDIDKEGNMPDLVDARVTNATTRFTLPKDMPKNMKVVDDYQLKPFHSELPLVFMTVLTQMSLGGFFALFMGQFFALFGAKEPSWILALFVMLPSALGLPLSALHLGRPGKAIMAMKNIKSSWLSREALALGIFTALMMLDVVLYFIDASTFVKFIFDAITLAAGIYGIYSQGMIYQITARPSWNRKTTLLKFFGVAYTGIYLIAIVALIFGYKDVAMPIIATALLVALAQGFFSYEDWRNLDRDNKYSKQLQRTKRLYKEFFEKEKKVRIITYVTGAILLPLFAMVLISLNAYGAGIVFMILAWVIATSSELLDRYLFYVTSVPLQMAGGFFVGKQR